MPIWFWIVSIAFGLLFVFGDRLPKLKALTGARTMLWQAFLVVIGVLEAFNWRSIIEDPQHIGWLMLCVGLVGGIARLKTTSPVKGL